MIRELVNLWYRYKRFVEDTIQGSTSYEVKDITYWREKLFADCILYSIPVSLIALIPSVVVTIQQGLLFIPAFDLFTLITVTAVTLNKTISLTYRKLFVVIMLYLLAIILMGHLGSFGMGSIYLLALSVFIALLFRTRAIYLSVVANIVIYACFALIIKFKLLDLPLISKYDSGVWVAYSSNVLFLNIVVVLEIRHLINGLEQTVVQEAGLRKTLQIEVADRMQRNEQLIESEEHYKSLFFQNPSPMWIFDSDDLRFLQVNQAAIREYGYTEDEFLSMKIKDIRPAEEILHLLAIVEDARHSEGTSESRVIHMRKNGEKFYAEVSCNSIPFKGKNARLVIARNITAHIQYTQAIEEQNAKLREIAYMQSHVVRAPLCRILGLIDLINRDIHEKPNSEMIGYLSESAMELDEVVKAIVNNAAEIKV